MQASNVMNREIRVLVIEHSLPFYHLPAWELLGSHPLIELTVAYGKGYFTNEKMGVPEGMIQTNSSFKHYECRVIKRLGEKVFLWHKAGLECLLKGRYDIVIHQFELKMLSLIPALFLTKIKRGKFLLWGIGDPLEKRQFLELIRKSVSKLADGIAFYSETNRMRYIQWGLNKQKLFVAKNSVDVKNLCDLSQSINSRDISEHKAKYGLYGYTIMTMGRLIQRKRIDWLISAFCLLTEKYRDIKLVIIGDGPEKEGLIRLTEGKGIREHVIFTGRLTDRTCISRWFKVSDLVVAPAQVGHLATESHAFGIPMVISDYRACQGPEAEILIPNVTGLKYSHGNISDLSEKISIVLDSDEIRDRYSLEGPKRANAFCGTEKMVNGFLEAIESLLNCTLQKF